MDARPTGGPAALSVVVTTAGDLDTLGLCLTALDEQPAIAEIVVASAAAGPGVAEVVGRHRRARLLRFDGPRTVPSMRWAAVSSTSADVVAVTESRMLPDRDWAARHLGAHRQHPEAVAIGGSVSLDKRAAPRDRALYLNEYPSFVPPVAAGPVRHLTGANVSYKRAALDEHRDVLASGCWEPILHDRFLEAGRELRLIDTDVRYQGGLTGPEALAMRLHYGRQYAADRSRAWPRPRKMAYGLASPLLTPVLLWRLRGAGRGAAAIDRSWSVRCWLLAFTLFWSMGEGWGYLAGAPRTPRVY